MTLAFHMTADQALQFFELCQELNLETEEERVNLLKEMIAAGFDITVFQTSRSPDQIAKDAAKNYGDVLHLKLGDDNENDYQTDKPKRKKHNRRITD